MQILDHIIRNRTGAHLGGWLINEPCEVIGEHDQDNMLVMVRCPVTQPLASIYGYSVGYVIVPKECLEPRFIVE